MAQSWNGMRGTAAARAQWGPANSGEPSGTIGLLPLERWVDGAVFVEIAYGLERQLLADCDAHWSRAGHAAHGQRIAIVSVLHLWVEEVVGSIGISHATDQ